MSFFDTKCCKYHDVLMSMEARITTLENECALIKMNFTDSRDYRQFCLKIEKRMNALETEYIKLDIRLNNQERLLTMKADAGTGPDSINFKIHNIECNLKDLYGKFNDLQKVMALSNEVGVACQKYGCLQDSDTESEIKTILTAIEDLSKRTAKLESQKDKIYYGSDDKDDPLADFIIRLTCISPNQNNSIRWLALAINSFTLEDFAKEYASTPTDAIHHLRITVKEKLTASREKQNNEERNSEDYIAKMGPMIP